MRKCEIKNKLNTKLKLKFTSKATVSSYLNAYYKFSNNYTKLDRLSLKDIEDFLLTFKHKYSISYYNQMVSMLKFLYSNVFNQTQKVSKLKLLKQPDTLHKVLSPSYVLDAIRNTKNLKHKTILSVLFQTGVRVSELLNIKLEDIDSKNNTIHIRKGKGHKDRYVPATGELIILLRKYWLSYKPKTYLFEGLVKSTKYSETSVRNVCKKAGINNPHLLRHSIITHLIDSGDQQTRVQMFAGHKSSQSTLKYYHTCTSQLKSLSIPKI